jgi:SAM-dependent methyltransferase
MGIDLGLWRWSKGSPFVRGTGYQLPFRDGTFDAVGSLTVLEHLDRPVAFLEEMVRIVKPGGRVVVATPNMYGSILLHPGDSVTHTGGFPRFAKNLGLHLKKQVESVVAASRVSFDTMHPDMTNIPEHASDYDAICATDPAVLRAVLRRFGVRVIHQSTSLEYPKSQLVAAVSKAADKLPFVRDLFGGIFIVGERHRSPRRLRGPSLS